jgi:hypothetical protein
MDLSKLSTNQMIAGGAGILALIAGFLPWYGAGYTINGFGYSINGFGSGFWAWFGILLAIAAAVVVVLKALEVYDLKAGNLAAEQIALLLGALGVISILLRLITLSNSLKFGLFIGLIAAAGVTYGAFGAMKDAGMAMPSADDFKSPSSGGDA